MKIAGVTGGANYLGTGAWSNIDSAVNNPLSKGILVTRHVDFVSTRLRALAATGKLCPVVLIDFVETVGGSNVLVMEAKMEQVGVGYIPTNTSTQIESFLLNYEKNTLEYYSIQPRPTMSAVPTAPARRP
jgi:type VI protein secretion system component Hcp